MAYNRFRANILIRVILLFATLLLSLGLYFTAGHVISSAFLLLLAFAQVFLLIHAAEKTNRDLARFLSAIQFSDYSESFLVKDYGSSFRELNEAFSNIIGKFRKTRSETEEQALFFQTALKNVSTGLISWSGDGDINHINNAAKEILSISDIRNLSQLNSIDPGFTETLMSVQPGQRILSRIKCGDRSLQLSISSAEIKMRGLLYKLISIQDITSELERERLHNELEIARNVHKKLLPESHPKIPGYTLNAKCIPALEVGGDYFDFIRISKNKTGIVIADVSGKGLPAAIYMTLTKGIFQSFAGKSASPRDVLIHLNEIIYRTIERGSFITMFYGIIDSSDNTFTYSRAGHEPVIMCGSDGRSRLLKPAGMALGLENGELFARSAAEEKISLTGGDTLFFYTDGFTDCRNRDNEDFGLDNIIEIVKDKSSTPALIADEIQTRTTVFRQDVPQYDDMTFIALTKKQQ